MSSTQPKITKKDLDQLLHDFIWAVSCKENNHGPMIALSMLEDYFQAAINQQTRISRKKVSFKAIVSRGHWNKSKVNLSQLFRDIHFYLISWSMIIKLSYKFKKFKINGANKNLFPKIGRFLKQFKGTHDDYKKARDYLEHIDERLPGDEKRQTMSKPNVLSLLKGNVLSLGGHEVDTGKPSLEKLRSFVTELKLVLLNDCCEYLKDRSPSDLDLIILRWQRDRDIQRLTRRVTNKGRRFRSFLREHKN